MDLWIRNQDREELIPIKTKLKIYDGDLIQISINPYITERHFNIMHGTDFLGEYKSKERALEVLDEIQSAIEHKSDCYYKKEEDALYNIYGVYEMPKE